MSNEAIIRSFEGVSVVLYVLALLWILRLRNPVYLGAYLGATLLYGYDWMWFTKGFFNATFNAAAVAIPGTSIQGLFVPYSVPLNYGLGFGLIAILLVRAGKFFDRSMGRWQYPAIWLLGVVAIGVYEIPIVHVLKVWTYHQRPEYMLYGFPWSNFWLAGNLVLGCYAGLRACEAWADLPERVGFGVRRTTTWKGLTMGLLPIWGAFYATQLIQMFWYAGAQPWVESGRPF